MRPESRRPPRTVSRLHVPRGLEMKQGSWLVAGKNTVVRGAPSSWRKLLYAGGWDGLSGRNLAERKQREVWKQPCDSRKKNQNNAERPLLTHNRVISPFFLLPFPSSYPDTRTSAGNKGLRKRKQAHTDPMIPVAALPLRASSLDLSPRPSSLKPVSPVSTLPSDHSGDPNTPAP